MPEQALDLNIFLQDKDADREELDRLTHQLRDEIDGLDVAALFYDRVDTIHSVGFVG